MKKKVTAAMVAVGSMVFSAISFAHPCTDQKYHTDESKIPVFLVTANKETGLTLEELMVVAPPDVDTGGDGKEVVKEEFIEEVTAVASADEKFTDKIKTKWTEFRTYFAEEWAKHHQGTESTVTTTTTTPVNN